MNESFFAFQQTLNKIKQFNFSVGVFAPGWTFERVQDQGVDPFTETGTDSCNQLFIYRNNRFWSLLWRHLYTCGPTQLPFYTAFCLGSGKRKFRDGRETHSTTWFSLMEHQIQPLMPSPTTYQHYFEDAFHGGSCLKLNGNVKNVRLFVSDFDCDNDIIVSYAFKRTSHLIHLNCVLNVGHDEDPFLAVCGEFLDGGVYKDAKDDVRFFEPLCGDDLHGVVVGLSERRDRIFPTLRPINGWEIR